MNTVNPKELTIVKSLPPVAKKGDKISIDTEFFGMDKKRLHRPHGTFAYMGCSFDGKTVYYIDDESEIEEFLKRLDAGVWIFAHAKFDITQLRRYTEIHPRKNLWDVILIEQIQYSGYYTDFGLSDLVRRYLDTYMPKEVRKEFSSTHKPKTLDEVARAIDEFEHMNDTVSMTQEQIEYASADVAYTWRVWEIQREKISEGDLKIYREIELPFLWTLLSMSGVRIDTEKWLALAEKNEKMAKEIQDKYGHWIEQDVPTKRKGVTKHEKVFVGVNLNSPAQVKKHFAEGGLILKSTDAEAMENILTEDDEDSFEWRFASDLLTYRMCSKRASTYGAKFITDHVESDGKVYADIYQIGAETGRTSCRAPNLQNQPHETEYRECFIADEDEVMIVADWGSQEPRIAAFLSEDDALIDALNSGEKLYIRVARDVLGKTITKQSPEYTHIKSTVLGIFYGMSAKGLAQQIGASERQAQEMIDMFLDTYPGVKGYMRKQKRAGDYVESIYGRKIWLNKYSFQWERNSLNAPIQSSAADAMKIAAARFVQAGIVGWKLTLLVHDEIVIKVPKQDCAEAMKVLSDIMIGVAEEMHPNIKGSVEIFSGSNWAVKH